MNNIFYKLKKTSFYFSSVFTGICMLFLLLIYILEGSILSTNFHKSIIEKRDIPTQVYSVINTSITDYLSALKESDPSKNLEVFSIIRDSITQDMVTRNIHLIIDGLFEYFNEEKSFLPDIWLNTQSILENVEKTQSTNFITSTDNLAKIDNINLGAILLYIDRTDIVDYMNFIKMIFHTITTLPSLLWLVILFSLLLGLMTSKNLTDIIIWLRTAFVSIFILTILCIISLALYCKTTLPKVVYPLSMSLPLDNDIIIIYLMDIANFIFIILSIASIITLVASFVLYKSKAFTNRVPQIKEMPLIKDVPDIFSNSNSLKRHITYTVLIAMVFSGIVYKTYAYSSDFESKNYSNLISKIQSPETFTKIISAKDDTIYNLQVNILDKKTEKPIPNVSISASGKGSENNNHINENAFTDTSGVAKFILDKGTFRLSFPSYNFPKEYQIPSPLYVDLKLAGTTVFTVFLEYPPEIIDNKLGIVEIEVLGKDNKPLQNLELTLEGVVTVSGNTEKLYSVTNHQGISVFKIPQGDFRAYFPETKFPLSYYHPGPISIESKQGETSRYTYRLVDKKQ